MLEMDHEEEFRIYPNRTDVHNHRDHWNSGFSRYLCNHGIILVTSMPVEIIPDVIFVGIKRDFTPMGFSWGFIAFKEPFVPEVTAANDERYNLPPNGGRPRIIK